MSTSLDDWVAAATDAEAIGPTDGIPTFPVTEQGLAEMVAWSGRAPEDEIGRFPGRSDAVTVQDVASVALLAGCLPKQVRIVLAAFEAMLDGSFPVSLFIESRGSFFPLVVVHGPARLEAEVNCRSNVLGPGHRANATIGRALRLGLIRLAGATYDGGDRSALGSAYKFTCVVGEDAESSPWPPLHTRRGFTHDQSVVTVAAAHELGGFAHLLSGKPEHLLRTYADELSTVSRLYPLDVPLEPKSCRPVAVLLVGEEHAGHFGDEGWSRERMQQHLHAAVGRPAGIVREAGYHRHPLLAGAREQDRVSLYSSPDDFLIVSTGSGGGVSAVGPGYFAATREIPDVPRGVVARRARSVEDVPEVVRSMDDYAALIDAYVEMGVTDGWPVIPPEPDRVEAMIADAQMDPDEIVGTHHWRDEPITVRDVAVNACMAGCSAQQLPVVATMARVLFAPQSQKGVGTLASVTGFCPWFVVHGPIAAQIGMNTGANLFGPGAPVNTRMGRASRLVLGNLAGLRTNVVDRAALGQPYKYGAVIADAEAAGWETLHVSNGHDPAENAVTVFWARYPRLTLHDEARSAEELLLAISDEQSTVWNWDSPAGRAPGEASPPPDALTSAQMPGNIGGVFVVAQGHREVLDRDGWSRRDVQEFLYQHAGRTAGELRAAGFGGTPRVDPSCDDQDFVRRFKSPDSIHVLVGGGEGGATMSVAYTMDPVTLPLWSSMRAEAAR